MNREQLLKSCLVIQKQIRALSLVKIDTEELKELIKKRDKVLEVFSRVEILDIILDANGSNQR